MKHRNASAANECNDCVLKQAELEWGTEWELM